MRHLQTAHEITRKTALLFVTLGLALVMVNLLLILQNKELKAFAGKRDLLLELQPGTILPALNGTDINGNNISVDYGRDLRKTLLLVMSPSCRACDKNMPNWEEVVSRMDKSSYRAVIASLKPAGLIEHLGPSLLAGPPVIAEIDPKSKAAYNLVLTPQTILISPGGQVEKVWTGVLDAKQKQEVGHALNITIP